MSGQLDRCDRTAYVSGLQPTVSDLELFEVFNRVAHVEKVILRNGSVRHALVVFKTVQGLYTVLIQFQGTQIHGRQIHIRPLRESSHTNSSKISTMVEQANIPVPIRRPAVSHAHHLGQRPTSEPYPFPPEPMVCNNMSYQDYVEGARRFDQLANVVCTIFPSDLIAHNVHQDVKSPDLNALPTWKMQLQIKNQNAVQPNQLADVENKKNRPNLSVINPALFYDVYSPTRTESSDSVSRDMTNDELSDMIVSARDLRVSPSVNEPAPWSPVNRSRADSSDIVNRQSLNKNGGSDLENSRLLFNTYSNRSRNGQEAFHFPTHPQCRHLSSSSIHDFQSPPFDRHVAPFVKLPSYESPSM